VILEETPKELLAVGQDVLATALSAIPVFGGVLAGASQTLENHKVRRELAYWRSVIEELQTVVVDQSEQIHVLHEAFGDVRRTAIISQGLDIAVTRYDDEQLTLVGELVATAILPGTSDDGLSRAQMLLDLLGQLESAHLEVLRRMVATRQNPMMTVGHDGVLPTALEKLMPDLADVMDPLTARLSSLGLIENIATGRMGGAGVHVEWWPTAFGWKLLDYLRASSES
jgi:hypothetical protein